jgi:hypothetical protein
LFSERVEITPGDGVKQSRKIPREAAEFFGLESRVHTAWAG